MSSMQKLIQNVNEYGTLLQFLYDSYPTILAEFKIKKSVTFETGNESKVVTEDVAKVGNNDGNDK